MNYKPFYYKVTVLGAFVIIAALISAILITFFCREGCFYAKLISIIFASFALLICVLTYLIERRKYLVQDFNKVFGLKNK